MGGSYSSSYNVPAKKLAEDVVKTIIKREKVPIPFIVHRCSKLTMDLEGYNIWLDVCNFVYETTGKIPQHKKVRDSKGELLPYEITDNYLYLPEGDVEAAIHDMCHWIVADDDKKELFNCGMNKMEEEDLIRVEELAWTLETWIFSAIIGEPDLVELVSPHAEIETFHYWVRVNNPISTTIAALTSLNRVNDFNTTLLRRILANWIQWKEKNPSKDAMVRGCLGWNQIGLPIPTTDILTQPIGYVKSVTDFQNALTKKLEVAKEYEFSRKVEEE